MKTLTDHQKEIVREIALGLPIKAVASNLGISSKTVEWQLYCPGRCSIRSKVGHTNCVMLTHWAILNGLVKLGEPLTP